MLKNFAPYAVRTRDVLIRETSLEIKNMALAKENIVDLYRKRAANYDISANLYYLTHLFFPRY